MYEEINLIQTVTVEDCIDNKKYKDKAAVIEAGKVIGWITEKEAH